jgi:hypothetical protein
MKPSTAADEERNPQGHPHTQKPSTMLRLSDADEAGGEPVVSPLDPPSTMLRIEELVKVVRESCLQRS